MTDEGRERHAGAPELPPTEAEPRARPRAPLDLERGAVLGRYLVLERLGAGGMGVVYAAYDPELDRRVAVKLLRVSDAPEGRARLLREAQAMARLQHPNVIAVHDVGTFGEQVFVAMELVPGETLADLLRAGRLPWRRAVALCAQAGAGLAAAHAAGLVHRDFKPHNVLVGADGRVRVLDFGLARAAGVPDPPAGVAAGGSEGLGSAGLLATPLTVPGSRMGTPAYMAPEQLAGEGADARSDQFSFCVALYEALYGERPFAGRSLAELRAAVAAGPREEPTRSRLPRGLRAAVLRGLRADPEERFADMHALLAALAADPERTRRRRVAWAAAGLAVAAAVLGGAYLLRRQSQLCSGAELQLHQRWSAERQAKVRAAFAATGVPYAADAWRGVEQALAGYAGAWAAARTEACAATRLRGEQSEEVLDLRMICLDARLAELGALVELLERADARLVQRAVHAAYALTPLAGCADVGALRELVPPPADPVARRRVDELRAAAARATALRDAGRFEECAGAVERMLPAIHAAGYRPLQGEALLQLGRSQDALGRHEAAAATLQDALAAALAGGDDGTAVESAAYLASTVGYDLARAAEGERWGRLAAALLERRPGDERRAGLLQTQLGVLYMGQGRYDDAIAVQREALRLREQALGADHPDTGRTLTNLAAALIERRRDAEAVPLLERALRVKEATLGGGHPDLSSTLNNLALALSNLERREEALRYLERTVALDERVRGPEHPALGIALANVAAINVEMHRYGPALAAGRRALAISEKTYGPDHPDVAIKLTNVADALCGLGQAAEALAAYRRALRLKERHLGSAHPEVGFTLTGLGRCLVRAGRPRDAIPHLRRAVALRAQPDVGPELLAESRLELSKALRRAGVAGPEARTLCEQARAGFQAAGGRPRELLAEVEVCLGEPGL